MRSAAALHAARPGAAPDVADGGGVAAALDGAVLGGAVEGEAGALGALVVTVTVAVGAAGWPGAAEPQAATGDDASAAAVSHPMRPTRPDVLAAIACLAARARLVVVASGARAGGRVDVGMTCSFERRGG
jgi:hypothetical protein